MTSECSLKKVATRQRSDTKSFSIAIGPGMEDKPTEAAIDGLGPPIGPFKDMQHLRIAGESFSDSS
jgi:hypothetical protein